MGVSSCGVAVMEVGTGVKDGVAVIEVGNGVTGGVAVFASLFPAEPQADDIAVAKLRIRATRALSLPVIY